MERLQETPIELEQELLAAATRSNPQRLDALLADDFLEVGANGHSFGKSNVLGRLPGESGVTFTAKDMQAHVLAHDVVLVTYSATRTFAGETAHSKRSSVWVRHAGRWQMRYHQGTNSGSSAV